MGSALGSLKIAAAKVGLDVGEYLARIDNGEKWCTGCKAWHARAAFGADASRADGLAAQCLDWRKSMHERRYQPKPRVSKAGSFFVPPRDGDKIQARARVNHAVKVGRLPDPDSLPCTDCGHERDTDGRRHEYDHHLGYSAEHQLSVQAVCVKCHRTRDAKRRRAQEAA